MRTGRFVNIMACCALALGCISCLNDVNLNDISDEFALTETILMPLGEDSATTKDIIDSLGVDHLVTDGTEIFYETTDSAEFQYRDLDLSENVQTMNNSYNPAPGIIPPHTTLTALDKWEDFVLGINNDPASARTDSAIINSATFSVNLTPINITGVKPENVIVELTFPSDRMRLLNGDPVTIQYTPTSFGTPTPHSVGNFKIYMLNSATIMPVNVKLILKTGSTPISFTSNSQLSLQLDASNIDFEVAYGDYQPSSVAAKTIEQRIDLDNTQLDNGFLRFANPKFYISASSNIGMYLNFNMHYLKATHDEDPSYGTKYAWFDNHTTNSRTVSFNSKPGKPGEWISQFLDRLDKDNGETDHFFDEAVRPNLFEAKYSVSKYDVPTDPRPDFITQDAKIRVLFRSVFPFYMKPGSYYVHTGTIPDVDREVEYALKHLAVDSLNLILKIKNGLPMKLSYDMVLYDQEGREMTTDIQKSYQLNSPSVDEDGYVITGSISAQIIRVRLSKAQVEDLKKTKYIALRLRVEGEDSSKFIQLRATDTFSVTAGLSAKGKLKTDDTNE